MALSKFVQLSTPASAFVSKCPQKTLKQTPVAPQFVATLLSQSLLLATRTSATKTILNFSLSQNYPNPFNPSTKINWQSPVASWQTLKVFDVLGNEVATLIDEYKPAGKYEVEFNPVETRHGLSLPSGVYFYQLEVNDFVVSKKMLLLK